MLKFMRQILREEAGAAAVEYGLIVSLIVLAMLTALQGVANETKNTWNTVSSKTGEAIAGTTAA